MKITKSTDFCYPEYMDVIYEGMYDDDKVCKKADKLWRCSLRTLGFYQKLVDDIVVEIIRGQRVCQLGVVFGNQIDRTAIAIGKTGSYDIIDVNKNVIKRTNDKYSIRFNQIKFIHNDAARIKPSAIYDTVICFLLLSEVPGKHKKDIINNALKMVKPEGKVIFVDWHNPLKWNPLGWPIKMYNRLYKPFVEELWDYNISDFAASSKSLFSWDTKLYLKGLFQKTIATRLPEDEQKDFMQLYL